jgi:hypothetical protein
VIDNTLAYIATVTTVDAVAAAWDGAGASS